MRTIPTNMLAAFQEQQGLQWRFIVEIDWHGEETVMYSDCEFADLEVYAYVKEFGEFESVSHVEGLGAVSSMSIVFFDQFGHFKEKLDTVDFFSDTTATVYLTIDGTELYDLFEGKINSDSISWSMNEFSIEILSKNIEKEIGYQPSIDDVDVELEGPIKYGLLERRLNSSAAWPSIFGTVKNYEIPIVWSQRQATTEEDSAHYDPGLPLYYELPIDSHEDFALDTEYFVNIVGRATSMFSILGYGVFTDNVDGDPVFRLTKAGVTSNWYQLIPFTILPDEGLSGETDQPITRLEIAPGAFTLSTGDVHTLGPDGEETEFVWLQYMKMSIRYTWDILAGSVTNTKYVNCIKHEGNIVTLNEKLTIRDDAYDIHISKVFKANGLITKIPGGSKIYVMGDRVSYVVDTKTETVIDRIAIKYDDQLATFDPATYEVLTTPLWEGTHPTVKYIRMLGEIYMRYSEHYALDSDVSEGLLCTAHNSFNTEALAIEEMSGLPTSDDTPNTVNFTYMNVEDAEDVIPEIAWQANKAVRYTRIDNDDALELIDLTDTVSAPVFTFNENNVKKDSIQYGFTSKDDLYTIFKADFQTNDMLKELETIRLKKNVDLYEELPIETDFYIFKNKSTAKTKLTWWRDKLSEYHYVVKLTGFMDAFGLEVWDRVNVNLDTTSFYDPADGTPFQHTHTASPQRWVGYGRVKEIRPNLKEGLIDFTIEIEDF